MRSSRSGAVGHGAVPRFPPTASHRASDADERIHRGEGGAVSQFAFLQGEWPAVHDAASRAEVAAHGDPRTACFYAPRALERAVGGPYKQAATLRLPYQDNLSALIHEPSFKQ